MANDGARQNLLLFLSALAFIILPGKKFLWMDGMPLDSLTEIFSVVAVALLFFIVPFRKIGGKLRQRYSLILVGLAIAKALIGLVTPANGLYARYFANPAWEGPPERSTEFIHLQGATRIDPQINFLPVGYSFSGSPFPLYFYNDTKRFNYYGKSEQRRIDPPFSVEWRGYLFIPQTRRYTLAIDTSDSVWVELGGQPVYAGQVGSTSIYLEKGGHPLSIRFSHHSPAVKQLVWRASLSSESPSVIPSRFFYPEPVSSFDHNKNAALIYLHYGLVGFWAAFMMFIAAAHRKRPARDWLAEERVRLALAFSAALVARTVVLLRDWRHPQSIILSGGDDWLMYEAAARSLALDDFLNAAFTGGQPFYFTPLYRYFLAAGHWLAGESPFYVAIVQGGVLFGLTLVMTYYLGKKLFSAGVGLGAAILLFSLEMRLKIFGIFLGEPVAAFLCVTALLLLLRFLEHKARGNLVLAGLLFGMATGIRPNLLPFVVPVLVWLYRTERRPYDFFRAGIFFLMPVAFVVALIAARNYLVSGKLVLFNTNAAMALWTGNPVPAGLTIKTVKRPLIDGLALAPETRRTLEFMLQAPGAFFQGVLQKFMFLLGVGYPPFHIVNYRVFLPNLAAVLGVLWSLKGVDDQSKRNRLLAIIFILLNMMIMAFTLVDVYGWRYILPVFPIIYIFASYSVFRAGRSLLRLIYRLSRRPAVSPSDIGR